MIITVRFEIKQCKLFYVIIAIYKILNKIIIFILLDIM